MSSDTDSAAETPDALPRHTTPTWEVELLISGVAVFAMIQLPGWLAAKMAQLAPQLYPSLAGATVSVFIYAMAAAVILAATFSIHLLLRAQWIARVGMHSVYPDGVLWDKLKLGSILIAAERSIEADPLAAIERADNRASIVFAVGVSLASTLISLTVLLLVLLPIGYLVARPFVPVVNMATVFYVVISLLFVPWTLAVFVDRWFGKRIKPGGRLWRTLAAVFRIYARGGLAQGASAFGILRSHHGRRRVYFAVIGLTCLCFLATIAAMELGLRGAPVGSYSWFPNFDGTSSKLRDIYHYADERGPHSNSNLPFVQSAVISGPYIELVVPYAPGRDPAAQRQSCPKAVTLSDKQARAKALLACLAKLHSVTLDGRALTSIEYLAGSDPATRRPALVAMIDARQLARGRHELTVAHPRWRHAPESNLVDRIVFWR